MEALRAWVAAFSFDLWILFCGGGEPIGVVTRRQLSSVSRPKSARGSSGAPGSPTGAPCGSRLDGTGRNEPLPTEGD